MLRRTSGSPPVRRSFLTPSRTKAVPTLARTAARLVNIGARRVNVAPDLVMCSLTLPRRYFRGPIAQNMVLGIGRVSDRRRFHLVDFAVLLQIENCELNGPRCVFLNQTRDFTLQTGAIVQDAVDVEPPRPAARSAAARCSDHATVSVS